MSPNQEMESRPTPALLWMLYSHSGSPAPPKAYYWDVVPREFVHVFILDRPCCPTRWEPQGCGAD